MALIEWIIDMLCVLQASSDLNMAFVFLNRFLDISEAVEEHDTSSTTLDNSDFAETEIPFDFPLPEKQFLCDADREKVPCDPRACLEACNGLTFVNAFQTKRSERSDLGSMHLSLAVAAVPVAA